jgi:pyruvate ferredoxin oxidoreductase gamma subunit/2-oxoisovalerate ferredoxin oxidoreductase gamma subunit
VNTAILGAFAAFSGVVKLESVCEAIGEEVPVKPEENEAAAREAAAALRVGPVPGPTQSVAAKEVVHA